MTTLVAEYKYNIAKRDGEISSASVFVEDSDEILTAQPGHPQWETILEHLRNGATLAELRDAFDVATALSQHFTPLSERVLVRNGTIYFDGDPVNDVLSSTIVKFHAARHKDFMALVNFMEKVQLNPKDHSREQLFVWLTKHNFAITPEGDFIAYKKVNKTSGRDDDDFMSVSSGHAIVNGRDYRNSRIPNKPGTIVEMPRSEVDWDPSSACSSGLHAANWRYAHNFSGDVLIRVQINPRDVVSVPTDSSAEKLRCCRYKVLNTVTQEDTSMLFVDAETRTLFVPQEVSRVVTKVPTKAKVAEKPKSKPTTVKAETKKVPVKKAAPVKKAPAKKAAPVKKATAKKAAPVKTTAVKKEAAPKVAATGKTKKPPKFYEDWDEGDFSARPNQELRWLVQEWGGKPVAAKRDNAAWLAAEGVLRRDEKKNGKKLRLTVPQA